MNLSYIRHVDHMLDKNGSRWIGTDSDECDGFLFTYVEGRRIIHCIATKTKIMGAIRLDADTWLNSDLPPEIEQRASEDGRMLEYAIKSGMVSKKMKERENDRQN